MVRRSGAERTSTPRSHGRTSDRVQVELAPSLKQVIVTHPFDLVQISRGLGPKSLDAQLVPILLAFPNIRESTRSVSDGIG